MNGSGDSTRRYSPVDLSAIKARADAATPAHWGYSLCGVTHTGFMIQEHAPTLALDVGEMLEADLEFIAHSREDIPALVAEVEHLRAALTRANALIDMYNCGKCFGPCGGHSPDDDDD